MRGNSFKLAIILLLILGCSEKVNKKPLLANDVGFYNEHTLAVDINGALWSWGGWNKKNNRPERVGLDSDWLSVSSGYVHYCAIKKDGSLWCAGDNTYGQLGNGSYEYSKELVRVEGDGWVYVSTGFYHTCGIKSNGTLWCWGNNEFGQLGDGSNINRNRPTQVGSETDWLLVSLSMGGQSTCGLKLNYTLWCWGNNEFGQLGDCTVNSWSVPIQVGKDNDWIDVSLSGFYTLAIKTDGTLWFWGWDLNWIISKTTDDFLKLWCNPVQVERGDSDWMLLDDNGGCGIKKDSELACFFPGSQDSFGTGWQSLSSSSTSHTTCGIKTDNTLWCWGDNDYGQIGDGTFEDRDEPVQVFYWE